MGNRVSVYGVIVAALLVACHARRSRHRPPGLPCGRADVVGVPHGWTEPAARPAVNTCFRSRSCSAPLSGLKPLFAETKVCMCEHSPPAHSAEALSWVEMTALGADRTPSTSYTSRILDDHWAVQEHVYNITVPATCLPHTGFAGVWTPATHAELLICDMTIRT